MLRFTVPGAPQGKGRARIVRIAGYSRMATPEKTVAYEGLVALSAQQAMRAAGITELVTGPVRVEMFLSCPIPASWSKKKQAQAENHEIYPTVKPDADNVAKVVCDALNNVLWKDDTQVVDLRLRKRYGRTPGVSVHVYRPKQEKTEGDES